MEDNGNNGFFQALVNELRMHGVPDRPRPLSPQDEAMFQRMGARIDRAYNGLDVHARAGELPFARPSSFLDYARLSTAYDPDQPIPAAGGEARANLGGTLPYRDPVDRTMANVLEDYPVVSRSATFMNPLLRKLARGLNLLAPNPLDFSVTQAAMRQVFDNIQPGLYDAIFNGDRRPSGNLAL